MPATPTVLWAQRSDKLYVTLDVQDVKDEKLDLTNVDGAGKLSFSGKRAASAGSPEVEYALELVLHGEIDVEASKVSVMPRNVFMIIQKKESSEGFWPRLMGKGTGKGATFIKTDWSKWVDEDEEDEKPELDTSGYNFSGFGGEGGGGMPDMGGMGGMPGMGGMGGGMGGMDMAALQQQLAGAGGAGGMDMSKLMEMQKMMGGMGGGAGGEEGDEEDSDNEEELPDLAQ